MSKKYVLVQNHVREIISPLNAESENGQNEEDKSVKKSYKRKHSDTNPPEATDSCKYNDEKPSSDNESLTNEELSDFKELRAIYFKCREILQRIESKYGNRLNLLDDESTQSLSKKRTTKLKTDSLKSDLENSANTCSCNSLNKKIIFDKSGNETLTVALNESKHRVCVCKQLESKVKKSDNLLNSRSAVVTLYNDTQPMFPEALTEDIKDLSEMLTDTELDPIVRYRVIEKIKEIQLRKSSELKLHKCSIVKKLKEGDSDIVNFHGANLMSMSGYLEPTVNEDETDGKNDL